MSEKRVAPPDGGSGDLVLIQRHLENLSAGEILEELDARMEEAAVISGVLRVNSMPEAVR